MTRRCQSVCTGVAFAAILLMSAPFALADAWLSVDPTEAITHVSDPIHAAAPSLMIHASDRGGFQFSTETTGVMLVDRRVDAGDFMELSWPDAAPYGDVGTPQMPVVRELFIAPPGAEIDVRASVGRPVLVDGALRVWPRQAPVEKLPGAAESAPFAYDSDVYGQDALLPRERVVVQELGVVRGQRLCLIEVYPVACNPALETVMVYPDITVDVTFVGGEPTRTDLSPMPGLHRNVLNPELLPPAQTRGTGTYLIVVPSAFESAMAPFISAKVDQGFTVLTYVPTSSSAATIKSHIQSLWDGGTALDYILLVGDTNSIGAWVGSGYGSPDTDLPYACMDGSSDWYPDIAVGRFPVRSTSDINTVVGKTLYYMDEVTSDRPYLKQAVFMASEDNYTVSEGTHNYCINSYLTPNGYTADKLYSHTYNATTQQVRNSFNGGRFFGIYSGHGAETYWADGPSFYASDVNGLTNDQMYSFVCSFACVTGSFDSSYYNECFTETWVLATNGAVTCWGSSVNSYWTEDDILQKRLFDIIFDQDPNAVVKEAGPIFNETKMRYLDHFGPSDTYTRRYFEMYNLMGDPSVWLINPPEPPTGLKVTPKSDIYAEGLAGGPFAPTTFVYTLENKNETPLSYEVTTTADWLDITDGSGTIPATATVDVTLTINSAANLLGNGYHVETVDFVNLTDHDGDTSVGAELKVGIPVPQFVWNLDDDPAWACDANWAWGVPQGLGGDHGGYDPTSGYTGDNVYGYNLAGGYDNRIAEQHLTAGPIDLTDMYEVSVHYYRWLNVEQSSYDKAYFRVSNDGVNWTDLWKNEAAVLDSSWVHQEFEISDLAANQPTVYLRWTMGATDLSWTYGGWNIDDIEIWALAPEEPYDPAGDMNCDGETDYFDINPFLVALDGEAAYDAAYPDCEWLNGDFDESGDVDYFDINPFVEALGS